MAKLCRFGRVKQAGSNPPMLMAQIATEPLIHQPVTPIYPGLVFSLSSWAEGFGEMFARRDIASTISDCVLTILLCVLMIRC